jgi:hypothetical protein
VAIMLLENLLKRLKSNLRITWDDEDDDIKEIIQDGMAYLNEKSGVDLDFEKDRIAIRLLLDYGRYVYNHSFELFEGNFQGELLSLSLREGVKDHATDSETNTETTT